MSLPGESVSHQELHDQLSLAGATYFRTVLAASIQPHISVDYIGKPVSCLSLYIGRQHEENTIDQTVGNPVVHDAIGISLLTSRNEPELQADQYFIQNPAELARMLELAHATETTLLTDSFNVSLIADDAVVTTYMQIKRNRRSIAANTLTGDASESDLRKALAFLDSGNSALATPVWEFHFTDDMRTSGQESLDFLRTFEKYLEYRQFRQYRMMKHYLSGTPTSFDLTGEIADYFGVLPDTVYLAMHDKLGVIATRLAEVRTLIAVRLQAADSHRPQTED